MLGLFALARIVELETYRDALKTLPLTILIALTHVHAIALVLTAGGLLALQKRPLARGLARTSVALLGCALPVLPWLWTKFSRVPDARAALQFEWHSLDHKLKSLFTYSLDNLPDERALGITTAAFLLITFGSLALTTMTERDLPQSQRHAPVLILLGTAGLYFLLPFSLEGTVSHWWTYPRFATYVLVAWLLIPRPSLSGWRALAVAPGMVLAFVMHRSVHAQFAEYGRYVAPYLEIVARLPKNTRFNPIDLDDYRAAGFRQPVLGQLHGYASAIASSYDPHLWDEPNNPLRFRHGRRLPQQNWFKQKSFDFDAHGRYYDYLIVHPLELDVIDENRRWKEQVELVHEAGQWRLYRVRDEARLGQDRVQASAHGSPDASQ